MANYDIRETLSGPALAAHLTMGEVATGSTNGTNTIFTTANSVYGSSIDVYVGSAGGFTFMGGNGVDYAFTAPNTITFNVAPPSGSIVLVDYIRP